jgi:hypothetical protein
MEEAPFIVVSAFLTRASSSKDFVARLAAEKEQLPDQDD